MRAGRYAAICVLGLRIQPDGSLRLELARRLEAAEACYRAGESGMLVLCGGRQEGTPCSEAEAMRDYLLARGLPGSAMRLEDASLTTGENLKNAAEIVGAGRVLVITSDYHAPRARCLCRRLGVCADVRGVRLSHDAAWWHSAFMECLYLADTLAGWQERKRKRPDWAGRVWRRLMGLPKDAPLPGERRKEE